MENILRFSRPTENQKETIPESIAAQWGPGYFYIIFWKWVALIFYRDIDCQSIVSVSGLSILWSSELAAFRESFTCPSVSGWISFFYPWQYYIFRRVTVKYTSSRIQNFGRAIFSVRCTSLSISSIWLPQTLQTGPFCGFRKVGPALHCLPLSCVWFSISCNSRHLPVWW